MCCPARYFTSRSSSSSNGGVRLFSTHTLVFYVNVNATNEDIFAATLHAYTTTSTTITISKASLPPFYSGCFLQTTARPSSNLCAAGCCMLRRAALVLDKEYTLCVFFIIIKGNLRRGKNVGHCLRLRHLESVWGEAFAMESLESMQSLENKRTKGRVKEKETGHPWSTLCPPPAR